MCSSSLIHLHGPQPAIFSVSILTLASTIAYNELKKNNPTVLKNIEDTLSPLSQFFMEPLNPFISAAEWPDDIKGMNWKSFNPLHFLNIPIIEPGFTGTIETSWTNASYAIVSSRIILLGPLQTHPSNQAGCSQPCSLIPMLKTDDPHNWRHSLASTYICSFL